jgi:hypothetical protein
LWPPKPKLFDSTGPGVQGKADVGTSTSRVSSRFWCPAWGDDGVLDAQGDRDGFDGAGCAEGLPSNALDARHRRAPGAEQAPQR